MVTEDYISFETAKLLKEKGFDEPCRFIYDAGYFCSIASRGCRWNEGYGDLVEEQSNSEYSGIDNRVSAPTLAMTMKWLREAHNLHISVDMGFDVDNSQYFFYVPSVCRFSNKSGEYQTPFGEKEFDSYEEACEAAIKYCLENLI